MYSLTNLVLKVSISLVAEFYGFYFVFGMLCVDRQLKGPKRLLPINPTNGQLLIGSHDGSKLLSLTPSLTNEDILVLQSGLDPASFRSSTFRRIDNRTHEYVSISAFTQVQQEIVAPGSSVQAFPNREKKYSCR